MAPPEGVPHQVGPLQPQGVQKPQELVHPEPHPGPRPPGGRLGVGALPVAHKVRGQAEEVPPQLRQGQLPVGKPRGPRPRAVDEEDRLPLARPVEVG